MKLKAGAIRESEDLLRESEQFLGPLSAGGRDLVRSWPSFYELLPNAIACRARPSWLRFDTRKAGIPDASNPIRLYANTYAGLADDRATRADVLTHLRNRARFDAALGSFMPASTIAVFSIDRETEDAYVLKESWVWGFALDRPRPSGWGDGTVPIASAAAAGARVMRRVPLSAGIAHRDLPNHPVVVTTVMRAIAALPITRVTRELVAAA